MVSRRSKSDVKMRRVYFDIPSEMHKKIKVMCAENDITMTGWYTDIFHKAAEKELNKNA